MAWGPFFGHGWMPSKLPPAAATHWRTWASSGAFGAPFWPACLSGGNVAGGRLLVSGPCSDANGSLDGGRWGVSIWTMAWSPSMPLMSTRVPLLNAASSPTFHSRAGGAAGLAGGAWGAPGFSSSMPKTRSTWDGSSDLRADGGGPDGGGAPGPPGRQSICGGSSLGLAGAGSNG